MEPKIYIKDKVRRSIVSVLIVYLPTLHVTWRQ